MPTPPPGFVLMDAPSADATPTPPPGFVLMSDEPQQQPTIYNPYAPREGTEGEIGGKDMLRAVADGLPFADRIAAGAQALVGVGDYESNLKHWRDEAERVKQTDPVASAIGNVAGSALLPVGALGAAANAATLGGKMLAGAATGAGIGGLYGASEAKDWTDAGQTAESIGKGALVGAGIGGAVPAVARGVGKIVEAATGKNIPATAATTEAIKRVADEGFDEVRATGVQIAPKVAREAATTINGALRTAGFRKVTTPSTFNLVKEIGASSSLDDLIAVRQALGKIIDPQEKAAAAGAIRGIDLLIDNLEGGVSEGLVKGNASLAAKIYREALGNYSAAKRAETVEKALTKAERAAGSAGSGTNIDNATRQQIKSILNSDKRSRGFSASELEQMERIVAGTKTGNAARLVGKLAPTGVVSTGLSSGMGAAASTAMGLGPIPGAATALGVGQGAKMIADASTKRQVAQLLDMIRQRSPLYQDLLQLYPPGPPSRLGDATSLLLGTGGTAYLRDRLPGLLDIEQ